MMVNAAQGCAQSTANPVPVALPHVQIPPLPDRLMSRSHLIARLDAACTTPLTIITAPAGFGKTTLLATWAVQMPQLVAWVTLTPALNDPARFWATIAAALQPLDAVLATAA